MEMEIVWSYDVSFRTTCYFWTKLLKSVSKKEGQGSNKDEAHGLVITKRAPVSMYLKFSIVE